ncbi:hypothetical protein F1188_13290 [Roseospira marina]|uniref:Uncharacterized protein n=2 Tax=Roseospira marina TaxID=140057 RepID=A0A5M6IB95_9PROT|nr:hypothetical protein [Roseospira marina]KAA5605005.1 hypothetical protein F1188_13290 [Roseospira marina]
MLDPTRPSDAPPPLAAPREIAPPPGGVTDSERTSPGDTGPAASDAEVSGGPLPHTIGLLTPRVGGFPDTLWEGTPGARVADLLAVLPVGTTSPVMADLRRRLLLSVQRAPVGLDTLDLLRTRLDLLAAAGASADDIMALAAPVGRDARVDRLRLRALLVDADDRRACALARSVRARYPDPIWEKATIHCDLLDGRRDAALLGLSLLREMGADTDASGGRAFSLLVERLAGLNSPAPDRMAGATPVAWRLLRRLPDVKAPPDAVDPSAPWTARALALAEQGGPPTVRAAAAETAAAAGAVSLETLGAVWAGLAIDSRDLETPVSQVVQGGTARARALAYAILFRETNPTKLAEGLLYPLETSRARTPGLYPTHARLYAPLIRDIPVEPRVPSLLGEAAGRALYTAGALEAGRAWLHRLEAQGRAGDTDAEDAAALVWPLARLADPAVGDAVPTDRLAYWRQARAARLGGASHSRETLDRDHVVLLSLLEALGADIGEAHWLPVRTNRVFVEALTVTGGHTAPDDLAALEQASAAGRLGETVALVLNALGPDGPAGASLETLRGVIRGLRSVGLDDAARRVAVEAFAVDGPPES